MVFPSSFDDRAAVRLQCRPYSRPPFSRLALPPRAGTVAIFSPSFLMVLLTVPYLDRLQHSLIFRRALRGILASFVGLLLAVTVQFALAVSWTGRSLMLALAAFLALLFKIDILWVVLGGACIAVFFL